MLGTKNLIFALTLLLSASDVMLAMPADTSPVTTEGSALMPLEKRSCPNRKRMYSWSAGCSAHWSGRCYDECIRQGPSKGCCQFVSSLIADNCGWVSKNCYCDCYIPN